MRTAKKLSALIGGKQHPAHNSTVRSTLVPASSILLSDGSTPPPVLKHDGFGFTWQGKTWRSVYVFLRTSAEVHQHPPGN